MYIFKNAIKNITRSKGRNILIGIIIIVIAAASSITLAIRESANNIVSAYQEKNKIEATIGMNRNYLMEKLREDNASQEDMINAFNSIESITEEEIEEYGKSDYISSFYYTYDLSVDAKDLTEATDSLVKEKTEVTTDTTTTTKKLQQLTVRIVETIQEVLHQEGNHQQLQLKKELQQLEKQQKRFLMKKHKMVPLL